MSNESHIEAVVMRRVHSAHALGPMVSGGAVALAVFIFALWGIGKEVWVAQVFANAPHASFADSFRFFLSAFENTRHTVQALCVATFAALLWFFRDLFRAASLTFARAEA